MVSPLSSAPPSFLPSFLLDSFHQVPHIESSPMYYTILGIYWYYSVTIYGSFPGLGRKRINPRVIMYLFASPIHDPIVPVERQRVPEDHLRHRLGRCIVGPAEKTKQPGLRLEHVTLVPTHASGDISCLIFGVSEGYSTTPTPDVRATFSVRWFFSK